MLASPIALARPMRRRAVLPALAALLVASTLLCATLGGVSMSALEIVALLARKAGLTIPVATTEEHAAIFFAIRLPRVVLGLIVGAGLGISGAAMQGVFRNPLADPALLGISNGGALGAVTAIVCGARWAHGSPFSLSAPHLLPVAAFLGALAAAWSVERLSQVEGRLVVSMFLLAGIAIASLCAAFTGLLTFAANDAQLRTIVFWTLGSLAGATWQVDLVAALFLALPVLVLPRFARSLNALLLGESEAKNLGVAAERLKKFATVLIALAVGTLVAVAGVVGFVGLIVPHVMRLTSGPDHRLILPGSALLGATLVVWADALARTAVLPAELPLGVVTASVGSTVLHCTLGSGAKETRVIEALHVGYRTGGTHLLDDISLAVVPGEIVALVGPNGAGKSTLIKLLSGELSPSSGEIRMGNKPLDEWTVRDRARVRAVVAQHEELRFAFTGFEVVLLGRSPHIEGSETMRDGAIARLAMSTTETLPFEDRTYLTLSGGERQRIQLARALAQIWDGAERVLLLDEPTNNLDLRHQHAVIQWARKMANDGVAVVAVLHDLNLAAQCADRIAVLRAGRSVATGRPETVLNAALIRDVFGVEATVLPHPELTCPLIVTRGLASAQRQNQPNQPNQPEQPFPEHERGDLS